MPRGPRVSTVLRTASLTDLHRAIAARRRAEEKKLTALRRRRRTVEGELAALDAQIADVESRLKGAGAGRRATRGRPRMVKRPRTGRRGHKDLALEVLRDAKRPLHQRDIAKILKDKKGVKSKSKAFDRSLGLMLSQDKRFKRVKRATYTLR